MALLHRACIIVIITVRPTTWPRRLRRVKTIVIFRPARLIGRRGRMRKGAERRRVYILFFIPRFRTCSTNVRYMTYLHTQRTESHACSTNVTPGSSQQSEQDSVYDIILRFQQHRVQSIHTVILLILCVLYRVCVCAVTGGGGLCTRFELQYLAACSI